MIAMRTYARIVPISPAWAAPLTARYVCLDGGPDSNSAAEHPWIPGVSAACRVPSSCSDRHAHPCSTFVQFQRGRRGCIQNP